MQSRHRNLFRKQASLFNLNSNGPLTYLRSFLWVWLTFILTLYASWMIMTKADFLYGVWYDYAGIGEHIDQYAPQNRFRHHFETTDDKTRKQLFAGIVEAIHNHGQGLKELSYPHPTQPVQIPLLHKAEIEHLTDVALLIDFLKQLGWALLILWAALTTYLLMMKQSFPTTKAVWGNIAIGLLLLAGTLAVFGAKKVFYQLHIWVFPAEHHWFFYYQDSLMSTMMKAPDLFAYISASLLLVGLILFFLVIKLFNRHKTL